MALPPPPASGVHQSRDLDRGDAMLEDEQTQYKERRAGVVAGVGGGGRLFIGDLSKVKCITQASCKQRAW